MEPTPMGIRYKHIFEELKNFACAADVINETNIYQKANQNTRKLMNNVLKENLLEGSALRGLEHFEAFYDGLLAGKRGLLLVEHFSNLDLPILCYLLDASGKKFAADLSQKIVAMAGMKLNEDNPIVKAWAEAFTRIVIYPSRTLASISDPAIYEIEEQKSRKINMAAMRKMAQCKKNGQPILVFPSGTRYRPGNPKTREGIREIDSYLRIFDIMLLISINGNCLRINPEAPENMLADLVCEDTLLVSASPVIECKPFRNNVLKDIPETENDKKYFIVKKIMDMLKEQHDSHLPEYRELYKKATGKESDYYA